MTAPREKKVLVIGDPFLCLIGAAAGADYLEFTGKCDDVEEIISKKHSEYGVIILSRTTTDKCGKTIDEFKERYSNILFITVESPKILAEIDPKKYYEEMIRKYIGLKISI
ncbi:MAG: hypothetical protein GXO43_05330 [Crenarchaeota archaeon]|nr:hypothetical protein [Thermoproteota archaeon]